MKTAIAILATTSLFALSGCSDGGQTTASVASSPQTVAATVTTPPPQPKARNNFGRSLDDMAGEYNSLMKEVNARLLLPQKLREPTTNESWKLYQQMVTETLAISFEVDNVSDKVFSMGLTAGPTNKDEVLEAFSAMTIIGATVFGKGDNAIAISSVCADAVKSKEHSSEKMYAGKKVYCGYIDGVYMAGISEPK